MHSIKESTIAIHLNWKDTDDELNSEDEMPFSFADQVLQERVESVFWLMARARATSSQWLEKQRTKVQKIFRTASLS